MKGLWIERESEKKRETGQNIANKIKYIYHSFSVTKLQKNLKKISLKFRFYINRIFTPERFFQKRN